MSLFDQIAKQAATALGGNSTAGAMGEVAKLIQGGGGLDGLLKQFQDKGLGEAAASWVGTGKNLSISKEQIAAVLGHPQIAGIAKSLGVSPDQAASTLASLLPQAVDQLTPNGKLPANDLLQQGLTMLKGLGK